LGVFCRARPHKIKICFRAFVASRPELCHAARTESAEHKRT
jgi:hypothetical protein